ncbi:MAG: hypothetical protein JO122_14670 [Acetobacteraceae bacterium]|nr:hypothetical protein [Acetobacteraceae bacterium]
MLRRASLVLAMQRSRLSPLGLYGVILALAVQLAAAACVLQPALATMADGVICHAQSSKSPAPAHDHAPNPAFYPVFLSVSLPAPTLAAAPALPPPAAIEVTRASLPPPARAPPVRRVAAACPRGPPVRV